MFHSLVANTCYATKLVWKQVTPQFVGFERGNLRKCSMLVSREYTHDLPAGLRCWFDHSRMAPFMFNLVDFVSGGLKLDEVDAF